VPDKHWNTASSFILHPALVLCEVARGETMPLTLPCCVVENITHNSADKKDKNPIHPQWLTIMNSEL
jgi:hypothetical protein